MKNYLNEIVEIESQIQEINVKRFEIVKSNNLKIKEMKNSIRKLMLKKMVLLRLH